MTWGDLKTITGQAGFTPVALNSPVRTAFTRGDTTLMVRKDGKWNCYTSFCGGKQSDHSGKDLKSLLLFLMSEYLARQGNTAT